MRLPLHIPLDARTGSATKDARLTNAVVESYQDRTVVSARPALNELATTTGTARGVECFGGTLIQVFGTALTKTTALTAIGTVAAGDYDFAQSME